jgi:hypothetical protein
MSIMLNDEQQREYDALGEDRRGEYDELRERIDLTHDEAIQCACAVWQGRTPAERRARHEIIVAAYDHGYSAMDRLFREIRGNAS